MKCIICQTNEVNPMIGGVEGKLSSSYCSRICWNLSLRVDMQYLGSEELKNLALHKLKELEERNESNKR